MMCYYLNVHCQGQRVSSLRAELFKLRMLAIFVYNEVSLVTTSKRIRCYSDCFL